MTRAEERLVRRKNGNNTLHGSMIATDAYYVGRAAQIVREQLRFEQNTGISKQLMKNGIWQVPSSERPKGWETMGGRER